MGGPPNGFGAHPLPVGALERTEVQREMSESQERSIEEILKDDHDEMEETWERAREMRARGDPQATEVYEQFIHALQEHISVEEQELFPHSLKTRGTDVRPLVEQLQREHMVIQTVLGKIHGDLTSGHAVSEEDEDALRNLLGIHNAREEGFYYPDFDGRFSQTQEGRELSRNVLAGCHCGKH